MCVHERAQASPCVCRHLCEVSCTCMLGDVSPLGSRRYLWACSACTDTHALAFVLHVCVSTHECGSEPAAASCLCVCRRVSVYTHVCTCMLVSASLCLTCEALRAVITVLGPWEPMMDLKSAFEGVFPLSLSPSHLIDILLPCSLPKDRTQASSVWIESSVGLEKNPKTPPGTASSVSPQVGCLPHGEKLLRTQGVFARPTTPPCQHLGMAGGEKEPPRARWGPEDSQGAD